MNVTKGGESGAVNGEKEQIHVRKAPGGRIRQRVGVGVGVGVLWKSEDQKGNGDLQGLGKYVEREIRFSPGLGNLD